MARKSKEPQPKIFTVEMELSTKDPRNIAKAVLTFQGINHSGLSYEGRVFLNNKKANEKTKKSLANGYAGSFFIFGHGGRCYGGPGHCAIPTSDMRDPYDLRRSNPLTPTSRDVRITEQFTKAIRKNKKITVTVVPVIRSYDEMADIENAFQCEKITLLTFTK
ncbi:MAG: hypothetical protein WAO91_07810 [Candidatus Nitrosotenuis sp.]